MRLAFLGGLLLAGCAVAGTPPVPTEARLGIEVLTVVMSDGMVCRASWTEDGPLLPCGLVYRVEVEDRPNPLRQAVEELAGALQAEGMLSPMARVLITDAGGRVWVFASPEIIAD